MLWTQHKFCPCMKMQCLWQICSSTIWSITSSSAGRKRRGVAFFVSKNRESSTAKFFRHASERRLIFFTAQRPVAFWNCEISYKSDSEPRIYNRTLYCSWDLSTHEFLFFFFSFCFKRTSLRLHLTQNYTRSKVCTC